MAALKVEQTSPKEIIELYAILRSTDEKALHEKYDQLIQNDFENLKKTNPNVANVTKADFSVFVKIARESNEESFVDYVQSGTVPPVKLNKGEMERLRGGGLGAFLAVYAVVNEVYKYVKAEAVDSGIDITPC